MPRINGSNSYFSSNGRYDASPGSSERLQFSMLAQFSRASGVSKLIPDDLPEYTQYRDTGCSLHPSCLNCSEDDCKEDYRRGCTSLNVIARDAAIVDYFNTVAEFSYKKTLQHFGVSRSTVYNVIKKSKQISHP